MNHLVIECREEVEIMLNILNFQRLVFVVQDETDGRRNKFRSGIHDGRYDEPTGIYIL